MVFDKPIGSILLVSISQKHNQNFPKVGTVMAIFMISIN